MWDIPILLAIISGSIAVGFFAGLLGIGGGMIMVPLILWILDMQNIHTAHAQHIAVGTSFAVMVFTSFSSALAQHRKGAVRWNIVRGMVPALLAYPHARIYHLGTHGISETAYEDSAPG